MNGFRPHLANAAAGAVGQERSMTMPVDDVVRGSSQAERADRTSGEENTSFPVGEGVLRRAGPGPRPRDDLRAEVPAVLPGQVRAALMGGPAGPHPLRSRR